MKLRTVFFLLVIGFFIFGTSWATIYLVNSGQTSFNYQIGDYLTSVIDSNAERINDVFSEVENDILFLTQSKKVKDILEKKVTESELAAKLDVNGEVSIIAREIENYLRSHPDMILEDFRENNEFRNIAVQKVGETGYSALLDVENVIVQVHIDPDVEGTIVLGGIRGTEEIDSILNEAIKTGASEGFYDWVDLDGKTRRKYTEIRKIRTKTADGVSLLSATTAYIDDYLVVQNVSDSLENYFLEFNLIRGYHNILFISKDNRIVYMAETMSGLGINLKNEGKRFEEISLIIDKLKGDEVGFYGPFVGHFGDNFLQFAAASKVYNNEEFLGTIVIIQEMDIMNKILEEGEELQLEGDEDYIVNNEGLLITPLRFRHVNMMVQEIKTVSVEECLGDFEEAKNLGISVEEYEFLEREKSEEHLLASFLNFQGDLTYGLHRTVDRVYWCILSEVNADKILQEPMEKSFKQQIIFGVWMLLGLIIITTIGSLFISKRWVLEKRKKKVEKFKENFFTRLNLIYYFLFAIAFAVIYLYIVTSFFQGIQNAKLSDAIPDMFVFVVGFMIFAIGLKIRVLRARYFIIYGGLLICLRRMLDIPLQEYQLLTGNTLLIWVPVLAMELVGFLLLLVGFRRLKNA